MSRVRRVVVCGGGSVIPDVIYADIVGVGELPGASAPSMIHPEVARRVRKPRRVRGRERRDHNLIAPGRDISREIRLPRRIRGLHLTNRAASLHAIRRRAREVRDSKPVKTTAGKRELARRITSLVMACEDQEGVRGCGGSRPVRVSAASSGTVDQDHAVRGDRVVVWLRCVVEDGVRGVLFASERGCGGVGCVFADKYPIDILDSRTPTTIRIY